MQLKNTGARNSEAYASMFRTVKIPVANPKEKEEGADAVWRMEEERENPRGRLEEEIKFEREEKFRGKRRKKFETDRQSERERGREFQRKGEGRGVKV